MTLKMVLSYSSEGKFFVCDETPVIKCKIGGNENNNSQNISAFSVRGTVLGALHSISKPYE